MHELSIAMSILDIAEEESRKRGDAVVRAVHLRVGPLAGVVQEALTSAYEMARQLSPWPNVKLVIEEAPLVVHCPDCDGPQTLHTIQDFHCPQCGSLCSEVLSGRELEVTAMELEV